MQDGPMRSLEGGYSGSWRPRWLHFPAFQGLEVIKEYFLCTSKTGGGDHNRAST